MPRLALRIDSGAEPEALSRLVDRWQTLRPRSHRPVEEARTILPGFAALNRTLGFFANSGQPAVSEDGETYLWLDGELWDRAAAREALGQPLASLLSDPELCLRLYRRCGDRFIERMRGQFIVAVYEPARQRLLLGNDRYGFRPFFWRAAGGGFAGATELKAVLAAEARAPELDAVGVLELLSYGFQLGDRTLFKEVRVLPPGSRLVFHRGEARVEPYWRFRYPERKSGASERDLAAELAGRVRAACARQAEGPGRVGIALSAGLDSRIVAAALPPAAPPRFAYTHGYPDSLDVVGARRLAALYGMRHLHLLYCPDYLSAVGAAVVWKTEGCFPYFNATSPQYHHRLRPELDIILTGHAGPITGQTQLPIGPGERLHFDLESYLRSRMQVLPEAALRPLIAAGAWEEAWEALGQRFHASVAALGDQCRDVGDAYGAWSMDQRVARSVAHAGQVDRDDFEVRAPLLDYDVVDFFLQVPHRFRFAQRLYKRTLVEHFPEAARMPWSVSGGPVPGKPLAILTQFYLSGASRRLSRRIPALARRRRERIRNIHVVAADLRADAAFWRAIYDPFVAGDRFPDSLLDRAAARRLAEEHLAGTRNHAFAIACLSTLALVDRHFLAHGLQPPAPPDGVKLVARG
jgi:asparagine synthase (glutamine-hydrolysing)